MATTASRSQAYSQDVLKPFNSTSQRRPSDSQTSIMKIGSGRHDTSANMAAKMCSIRAGYPTYISSAVYKNLDNSTLYGGDPRRNMWEQHYWSEQGVYVYRSSFWWKP